MKKGVRLSAQAVRPDEVVLTLGRQRNANGCGGGRRPSTTRDRTAERGSSSKARDAPGRSSRYPRRGKYHLLITGETQPGRKSLRARFTAAARARRRSRINCAAIPEACSNPSYSVTSAHHRASVTRLDSRGQRRNILLDEIGELPLGLQQSCCASCRRVKSGESRSEDAPGDARVSPRRRATSSRVRPRFRRLFYRSRLVIAAAAARSGRRHRPLSRLFARGSAPAGRLSLVTTRSLLDSRSGQAMSEIGESIDARPCHEKASRSRNFNAGPPRHEVERVR